MLSRRNLGKGAAAAMGVSFCGCGLLNSAHAQERGRRKLPISVGGKATTTVDIHAHCFFQKATSLAPAPVGGTAAPGGEKIFVDSIEGRLRDMDAMAVDMEVLSINPFWYGFDRDIAAKIVAVQNESLAELCAAHPRRFAAFASLTLQDPALAVRELETAVKKQGLKGAAIGSIVDGVEFADPKFHPVWAKAEELGVALFIHPGAMPELAKRLKGNGYLINTIGIPLETTIVLEHLIFEGTLDKFPGLKVIAAHGGGYLGSFSARSDEGCRVNPSECNPEIKLKKKPSEYLKQLYFDSIIFTPEALRHLVNQVGASQIMMGSDHPYPWDQHPVDTILDATTLTDDQKRAILSGNAAKLLGLKL